MTKGSDAFPALTSKRLTLRQVEPRDVAGLHACFGDRDAMRYWNTPPSVTPADTEKALGWLTKTTSPHDHLAWTVAEKRSDRCIGMVNYHHRESRNRRLEIGYIIAPEHQGKGLGTEAVRALLEHCTGALGMHRVEALIQPDNTASIRLVERLGFRCEGGPLVDYWRVGERYASVMMYAWVGK
jgi:ribosomal-protein-alanine N-acetyltransferase